MFDEFENNRLIEIDLDYIIEILGNWIFLILNVIY